MARITVEDCLKQENNRFALVRLASRRAKQLLSGQQPVTDARGNKAIVSALREIADGRVQFRKALVVERESEAEIEAEPQVETQPQSH